MYTKENLVARLQNGEDVDTIAQEMATALNEAQAAVEEEAKRAEKQKAEESRVRNAKREAVVMMLDGISDYLIAAGEDELHKGLSDVDVDKMIKMLDSSIDMTKRLEKLKDLEFAESSPWVTHSWLDGFFN